MADSRSHSSNTWRSAILLATFLGLMIAGVVYLQNYMNEIEGMALDNDSVKRARVAVEESEEVHEILGAPITIEESPNRTSVRTVKSERLVDYEFSIKGPKGIGLMRLLSKMEGDQWIIRELYVETERETVYLKRHIPALPKK